WRNLRDPVRLYPRVKELGETGHDLFVEVSPHPLLAAALEDSVSTSERKVTVVPTLRREEDEEQCVLESLGIVHGCGYEVEWGKVFGVKGRVVELPKYPWERKPYWLPASGRRGGSESRWTLVDVKLASSEAEGGEIFEVELDVSRGEHAYLAEHR